MLRAISTLLLAAPVAAFGQGMDSTVAERNLLIMAEMLPGIYDNANQAYFDQRRGLPEADRHARITTTITRVEAPAFGDHVYLWVNKSGRGDEASTSYRIATLAADGESDEVTLRHYFKMGGAIRADELWTLTPGDLRRTEGCDYFFKRRAEHFRGQQREKACRFDWEGEPVYTANTIEVSNYDLFFVDHKYLVDSDRRITGVASGEPFWLERARVFFCYADIPGVAGGRDIPFERYDDIELHDRGGVGWFETRDAEPRKLGLTLRRVTWHVNNETGGNFNRDSLVLYALEQLEDGSVKSHSYAFTEPDAERIGMNMQWMLVNCTMTRRNEAVPALH